MTDCMLCVGAGVKVVLQMLNEFSLSLSSIFLSPSPTWGDRKISQSYFISQVISELLGYILNNI